MESPRGWTGASPVSSSSLPSVAATITGGGGGGGGGGGAPAVVDDAPVDRGDAMPIVWGWGRVYYCCAALPTSVRRMEVGFTAVKRPVYF